MKLYDLVVEIKKRARKDACPQLASLLKWIVLSTPKRSEYDRKRYLRRKEKGLI